MWALVGTAKGVHERELRRPAAPLLIEAIPRMIHEDAPHQPCRHGQEMGAIVPMDSSRVDPPSSPRRHSRSKPVMSVEESVMTGILRYPAQ